LHLGKAKNGNGNGKAEGKKKYPLPPKKKKGLRVTQEEDPLALPPGAGGVGSPQMEGNVEIITIE